MISHEFLKDMEESRNATLSAIVVVVKQLALVSSRLRTSMMPKKQSKMEMKWSWMAD